MRHRRSLHIAGLEEANKDQDTAIRFIPKRFVRDDARSSNCLLVEIILESGDSPSFVFDRLTP